MTRACRVQARLASLQAQTGGRDISKVSLLVREEEKAEHDRKLLRVEAEMTEVFKRKVVLRQMRLWISLVVQGRPEVGEVEANRTGFGAED